MIGLLSYGALTTKVSAMMGRILSKEDYKALSNQKSVQDAVNFIKANTAYGEVLKSAPGDIHRETLENLLKNSLFNDYLKLRKYIKKKDMDFLIMLMGRYEIHILKAAIRNCIGEEVLDNFLYNYPEEFEKTFTFNSSKIMTANNMDDIFEALEGSPYYKVLSVLYVRGRKPTLFEIETNLDIYYFSTLWRLIEKYFKGKNKEQIRKTIGTEADVLNILWIYRCKRYYNLPTEHIYALLLPVRYKLSNKVIQELVETNDFEDFKKVIMNTKYSKILELGSHSLYEKFMMRMIADIFKRLKRINPYNIVTVLGYIYEKELELENICSIMEGIRYGLSSEKIMEYVM